MKSSLKIDFQEGDLTTLHPHDLMIYLRGISIGKVLFEGLTRIDSSGKPALAGAKSVDVSPDGLRYQFQLRENHWSDGTPVTAQQFELSFKEALDPKSPAPRPDLLYMIRHSVEVKKGEKALSELGVRAPNDHTLIIELSRPSPHFLELLAQPVCAPLQNPRDRNMKHFNGPFMIDSWERNARLSLKPNPHFWNKDKVGLPRIDIMMVQEPETAMALYEQKQLDWIGVPLCPLSTEQIDHLKAKNEIISRPIERVFWVFLNTKHKALSIPAIRKALSLAISRETISNSVFIGSNPLDKPLPLSLLPLQSHGLLKEDLEEAKHQLALGLKELGITKEELPPLMIAYSQQANRKQLAEYLQEAWSSTLGIKIRLEPQEWNVLRTNLGNGRFEISGAFEASFYHDPLEIMERMAHLNSSNFPQWTFPLYQQKIGEASHALDMDHRMHLLSEAEDILIEQMPFIPITCDRFLFAHHPKLQGYTFDSVGAIDFSYASMK
ncbi:MAG: hypothetical protein ACD_17C00369G0003 [uncultured bacterium]|nr:MAG: hypothetical protein ACD_17C00369G0003 [uncultured bacterium]OGN56516.1 MAG: hypothetical protein A2796_07200 [Chlamydiae bacterium RIFCSPHIGHO2_01_FULL_44_39]OGN56915.1 MAG: hypothetical protein A3C42_00370 [Chlamydiae bacterium RIFCSPHIGHO2_02_FULL_45_9]OGN61020.1 MAG: hypothetical protein A3D96_02850 [Chlamydiae bacterium RIFCSPHIGHO2_12_FULL_44_59]OGN66796.1 MAG: hypothetical protein A2978_00335 [Chlamydiae bacterium RIFCSPLOWO2_01_FULL_44_52]OGN69990.1 MAG: hypothetical protein A3